MSQRSDSHPQQKFGTEKDVNRVFGLGVRFLQMARLRGHSGPAHYKIGKGPRGRILYSFAEVENWIAEHRCGGQGAEE